ncbi:MAG: N,N-dimethylformamidase beta subunit family domain-containing protein, partial [Acidimicrobiales bacterium]
LGRAGLAGAGCTSGRPAPRGTGARAGSPATRGATSTDEAGPASTTTTDGARPTQLPDGPVVQTAGWVQAENSRPGTTEWAIEGNALPHVLDGYADKVSAVQGETVTLYLSTMDPSLSVAAFRMGYYRGKGARLIWRSPELAGRAQPAPTLAAGINMVECHWAPSAKLTVTRDWPPGEYLLKLTSSSGQARYIPLVVRDDTSRAAYVIQSSVTTYQAYNWWGGYCLYYGPTQAGSIYLGPHGAAGESFSTRARTVSFDRPYPHDWAYGASDFVGNELPMVMLAEKLGLDVTYWTDIDLHRRPELLLRHRAMLSLGHDEYWSAPMFDGALAARDAGVNFLFLGANACYRHIRLDPSPLGPDRHEICYKVGTEDPLYGKDDAAVTVDWPDSPDPRPESLLIGNMYQSNGVKDDLVVVGSGSWALEGTGLAGGDRLAGVVGPEYDGYDPAVPGPRNLEVLAHSPVVAFGQPGYADMTWYTEGSSGGVFATGTNYWVSELADNPGVFNPGLVGGAVPGVTAPLTRITENVLSVCGAGPAGRTHPSTANWQRYYPGPGAAPGTASNYRTSWPA